MPSPFSLCTPEVEAYISSSIVDRIASTIAHPRRFSSLTALFSPPDSPRKAVLSRCQEGCVSEEGGQGKRKLFWLPPFDSWEMSTIGNLSLALLWHMYRTLPEEVLNDEKIIYKLGKISVTLPGLTNGLQRAGEGYRHDAERYTSIKEKAFPSDRKSSVSSIFSACEQITELSETFRSIGDQISSAGDFDSLVLPVIDIDICLPEQAISLLFAIRNFICSERISVIIACDKDILINFLISLYDNSLTQVQGHRLLLSFFDDWVYLPSPLIEKQLQSIDLGLTTEEKHFFISVINKSGILSRFSDSMAVHNCFHRFNTFLNNTIEKYSVNEYAGLLLLFLLGTLDAESVGTLALLSDLKQYVHIVRKKRRYTTRLKRKTPEESSQEKGSEAKDMAPGYQELLYANGDLINSVLSAFPGDVSDETITRLIVTAVSFV
jgi:hypothetical protein